MTEMFGRCCCLYVSSAKLSSSTCSCRLLHHAESCSEPPYILYGQLWGNCLGILPQLSMAALANVLCAGLRWWLREAANCVHGMQLQGVWAASQPTLRMPEQRPAS